MVDRVKTKALCKKKDDNGKGAEVWQKSGALEWETFIVKNIDYIANPSIEIKNRLIISSFVKNYIPRLEENEKLF